MKMKKKYRIKASLLLLVPILLAASCEEKQATTYTTVEGLYVCNERSAHAGVHNYFVEIDKVSTQQNLYIIDNFHNAGENEFIYAELVADTLVINNQGFGNFLSVSGKGAVSGNFKSVEFSYYTFDGVVQLDYYATFERE
jgi:hypothetical protein